MSFVIHSRFRSYLVSAAFVAALVACFSITRLQAAPQKKSQGILPGYKCPRPPKGGCVGPKDCLHPNPDDCTTFIQCNDAKIAYLMPCPAGLEWNNREKICDWPRNAKCPKPAK